MTTRSVGSVSTDHITLESQGSVDESSASMRDAYAKRFDNWDAANRMQRDEHIREHDKKKWKYWQSKLIGMIKPRTTHHPPAVSFGTGDTAGGRAQWGVEAAKDFIALLYMQKADWLNPGKIDKIQLARAVHEILNKNTEAALDAYRAAIHFPRDMKEIRTELGMGAGYYAHRWKPLALDSGGGLIGSILPFAAHADPAALATLHGLRGVLTVMQVGFSMNSGWERVEHFKDRESAAASMVAKALDVFSRAPTPWDAKAIGRELVKLAPELEQALKAALGSSDTKSLRELGPSVDDFEKSIDQIKAHLYNKSAELKGNLKSLKYRSIASGIKMTGGGAALAAGITSGPAAGGAAGAATVALSLIPHLVYHFTDDGVKDARDKGIALLENNLKMVSQWINTEECTAQEIAKIYENYSRSEKTEEDEALCRASLKNAFDMRVVPNMVELMGGIQATVSEKLLAGKLARAIGKMTAAQARADDTALPRCVREHHQRKADRNEQKAMRIFEDQYHLKKALHLVDQAAAAGQGTNVVTQLDDASEAFASITDEDIHTLLLSRSQQQQVEVMARARLLNKDDLFKYAISFAVGNVGETISGGATIGLAAHTAANVISGIESAPRRYGAAQVAATVVSTPGFTIAGQRANLIEAHGQDRNGRLTDPAHMAKSTAPLDRIDFSDGAIADGRNALRAALRQIKRNGATPSKMDVHDGDFQYTVDFAKTQPFLDEQRAAMPAMDKLKLYGAEAMIALRLFWVGLRGIGPDAAKQHLKATRQQRTEIFRLKNEMREVLREERFDLLIKAVNPEDEWARAALDEMDMDHFMRLLNAGLNPPVKTRVAQMAGKQRAEIFRLKNEIREMLREERFDLLVKAVNTEDEEARAALDGPKKVSMADAISKWMHEEAGNNDQLVLRTDDGRFAAAVRIDGVWVVACNGSSKLLDEFMELEDTFPSEIGVIPFSWRTDLHDRLRDFGFILDLEHLRQSSDVSDDEFADEEMLALYKSSRQPDGSGPVAGTSQGH